MAGESLFRQLEIEAFRAGITPRTQQSIDWFRKKARDMFRGRVVRNRKDILEDEAFHNIPQGQIWEWDSYRSYHAGTCMGVHHQYLFHFLGRPNK